MAVASKSEFMLSRLAISESELPRKSLLLFFIGLTLVNVCAWGDNKPQSQSAGLRSTPPMTRETRMQVIRSLNAERVFIRKLLPMGEKGVKLKDGVLTPDDNQIRQMVADHGAAARPGDRAQITNIEIKEHSIIFEINGGPKKKMKWYQRIQISGMGGTATPAPADPDVINAKGSVLELGFDKYVPEMTGDQIRELLSPVFDFHAKSAAEAYLETVPPKVREAIKNHEVLVGMNREMVGFSKGRAPRKIREREGSTEYEEWIYGVPPQDVEFIRFVGDQVTQVKLMKVDGEKIVRTQKEVDLGPASAVAQQAPPPRPAKAPTLRRPGETAEGEPGPQPAGAPNPIPSADPGNSPVPGAGTPLPPK